MHEKEIRSILFHVCKELDDRARRSAASAVLGASLLVTPGCTDDPGLPDADASVDSGTQPDAGAVPEYMAPVDSGASTDGGNGDIDSGTVTKYMAPFDSGSDLDSGAVAEYMAPIDSGPIPPYMAQQVDAGEQPIDAGGTAIYIAVIPE